MAGTYKYSLIIPVYNRPDELTELVESIHKQKDSSSSYEVIVVDDGSANGCREVMERARGWFDYQYHYIPNGGPGPARNFGVSKAKGEYVIILDSDCVLPPGYLKAVDEELSVNPCDAFGGPDASHESFTDMQKAISYSMTSFFTTGGIRGGKKKLDKFYPRSFNMGVRREVYEALGGFSKMRFGEDIDFSYRIFENGHTCRLFPKAWVWHKRRTDLRKFFKQVFNSGIARINLEKRHPGTMKLVHALPLVFTLGVSTLIILSIIFAILFITGTKEILGSLSTSTLSIAFLMPVILYCLLIFIDSSKQNKSLCIGTKSIAAAFVQLFGYGLGFLKAWWQRCVLKQGEFAAYEKNFYE